MTCWERLGISPTTDQKAIKRAYATKVKNCHQEDDPKLWTQLHDAYMQATKYANGGERVTLHSDAPQIRKSVREEEQQAKESKEQSGREMEQLFDQMRMNARQEKRMDMEELRGELEKLSQMPPEEEDEGWKTFLESWISQRMCLTEEYWGAVYGLLQTKELKTETYHVIREELKRIQMQNTLSLQATPALMEYIGNSIRICDRHLRAYEEAKSKKHRENKKYRMIAGFLVVLFLAGTLVNNIESHFGTFPKVTSPKAVKTELAAYLNEKYATDEYQPKQFELIKLEKTVLENRSSHSVTVGYQVSSHESSDFCALVLFKYDNKNHVEGSICFDNLQRDEIESKIEEEVKSRLNLPLAEGYLSEGEGDFTAGTVRSANVVYHTTFTGDLEAFAEQEKAVRNQIYQRYAMVDMFARSGEMNGSFILYFPDARTADIRARLTMDRHESEDAMAEELNRLQEELHMQMIAVGLTQSYYEAVFRGEQKNGAMKDDALRGRYGSTDLEVPLNPAFVSIWLKKYQEPYTQINLSGQQQSEDDSWVHVPEVTELADGIYVMPRDGLFCLKEEAEKVLFVDVDQKAGRILVDADDECQGDYVIVLDKRVLDIGEDYAVRLVNPEDGEDTFDYQLEPYNRVECSKESYMALLGEDMLILDYNGWSERNLEITW